MGLTEMQRRRDDDNGIEFTRRASVALNTLTSKDRAKVLSAIGLLQRSPDDPYITRIVKEFADAPALYLMKVTGTLRIIFTYSGSTISILDIVRSDRLKKMYGGLL
ncbi:unnamed protein product [marine sediment metagenome]|uniref:Uncharacterized protein n=1 Tax=marine sediment metagenome TaxID=412755 RepID=X1P9S8_9ZZZZ